MFPLPAPVPDFPDVERLRQLAESKPRSDSIWELGIFYLHAPLRAERGGRPYFPLFAMFVHTESEFVLSEQFMGAEPSDTDRQGLLVKLLEAMPGLPSEIVVSTPRMAQMMEPVTELLEITLSVDETPLLWNIREELFGFLDEVASGSL